MIRIIIIFILCLLVATLQVSVMPFLSILSGGIFLPLIIILAKVFFDDYGWQKTKDLVFFSLFSGLIIDLLSATVFPTAAIALLVSLVIVLILRKSIITERQPLMVSLTVFFQSIIFDLVFLLLNHQLISSWQLLRILLVDASLSVIFFWIIIYLSTRINPGLTKKKYRF